jgi:hypothetical protein
LPPKICKDPEEGKRSTGFVEGDRIILSEGVKKALVWSINKPSGIKPIHFIALRPEVNLLATLETGFSAAGEIARFQNSAFIRDSLGGGEDFVEGGFQVGG